MTIIITRQFNVVGGYTIHYEQDSGGGKIEMPNVSSLSRGKGMGRVSGVTLPC